MRDMAAPIDEDAWGDATLIERRHLGPVSEVYLARRGGGIGEPCVVKRVLPHARDDERVRAEFDREARLLAALHDRRFPRLLGRGERLGLPYLVLSFLPGPTVRALATAAAGLPRDPAWTTGVLALCLDVLGGLAVLHRRRPPVVHRDVSPENLLVAPDGALSVLDLGVALEGRPDDTQPIGKRAYMSPEQREGRALDGRADLYALGVVLWELLAGVRPHDRFDDRGRLPGLAQGGAAIDDWTARLVARLAEPELAKRPASAVAVARSVRVRLRREGIVQPRLAVGAMLERAFPPAVRAAWSQAPVVRGDATPRSAEERGEETTDRQPVVPADITRVEEPPTRRRSVRRRSG